MTGQTASKQILFYLNVHLFATIVSIEGVWEVGGRGRGTGIHPPPNTHTHTHTHTSIQLLEKVWDENLYQGYPCAMMTINNDIDYVTWLVCNLQTRDRFLNMSSKMEMISLINFVCQGYILSKISRSPQVSNLRNEAVTKWQKTGL